MEKLLRYLFVLVMICAVFILICNNFSGAAAELSGTRFSGSVAVPQWKIGDTWGYKIPQYSYSSYYFGVGFEVVGTETVNGYECYDVKIWWDASYGSDYGDFNMNVDVSGISYSYLYEGHAFFTKDKLAIAKFTLDLQMRMQFDGSEFNYDFQTRAQSNVDYSDYMDYLDNMHDWKYDLSTSLSLEYNYNPPFVMYDYPLELYKKWNSTSEVSIDWEYSTYVWMNDAMKKTMSEMYGSDLFGFDTIDEEGSDSTEYTLFGSFEVTDKDTIVTDTGTFQVFIIEFDVTTDFGYSRAVGTEPPESYGGISLPGNDATMNLLGIGSGSGKYYLDPEAGYAQKMELGSGYYYSDTYSSVEPDTIEDSYSELADSLKTGDDDSSDTGADLTLFFIILIITAAMISIFVILLFIGRKRANNYQPPTGYQNYHDQYQYPPPYR